MTNADDGTIVITGGGAQLAKHLSDQAKILNLKVVALDRKALDVTSNADLKQVFEKYQPRIFINCASYNLIDQAEVDSGDAMRINADAVGDMARMCKTQDVLLVHYSSSHVFDGLKPGPYQEDDDTSPVNIYGQSKLAGEQVIQSVGCDFLIFRLSWVFGSGKNCFLTKVCQWSKAQDHLKISHDEISVPTYSDDVARLTFLSIQKNLRGLFHLTSHGQCSRYEYVKTFCDRMGMKVKIEPVSFASFGLKARRPLNAVMSVSRFESAIAEKLPHWHEGLERFTTTLQSGHVIS